MAKYISDAALKIQQDYAPELKNYIRGAAKLADETVEIMESLPHIDRDDDRARTPTAHGYWRAYFWYKISADERIGAGFGYDLEQWKTEAGISPIPPWRICLYLWNPDSPHSPKALQTFSAIQTICGAKKGWWDSYVNKIPVEGIEPKNSIWLPVPKEFIRGLNDATPSANAPFLLAGAVNAFLGNLLQ